jgi:SpoVK/Ycf46/Vps4 family AAA+-type ATPase
MENLKGIMIATTNLTVNIDPAFDRRFLYKIEFNRPGPANRLNIWRSLMPELDPSGAKTLAEGFDFSGGQIENVVRRSGIDFALTGRETPLDTLIAYCREEQYTKPEVRIGFTA